MPTTRSVATRYNDRRRAFEEFCAPGFSLRPDPYPRRTRGYAGTYAHITTGARFFEYEDTPFVRRIAGNRERTYAVHRDREREIDGPRAAELSARGRTISEHEALRLAGCRGELPPESPAIIDGYEYFHHALVPFLVHYADGEPAFFRVVPEGEVPLDRESGEALLSMGRSITEDEAARLARDISA